MFLPNCRVIDLPLPIKNHQTFLARLDYASIPSNINTSMIDGIVMIARGKPRESIAVSKCKKSVKCGENTVSDYHRCNVVRRNALLMGECTPK